MKKPLIFIFVLLILLSSPALANEKTFIDDVDWGMSKSKVIENIDFQIINSNKKKTDDFLYTSLVFNGEFTNSAGNYQFSFANDQLYSISALLFAEEKDIAEKYYMKWKISLKENKIDHSENDLYEESSNDSKQFSLKNSRYEGNLYLVNINKANLSKFNINKNDIPGSFEYMVMHDISNYTILLNVTM